MKLSLAFLTGCSLFQHAVHGAANVEKRQVQVGVNNQGLSNVGNYLGANYAAGDEPVTLTQTQQDINTYGCYQVGNCVVGSNVYQVFYPPMFYVLPTSYNVYLVAPWSTFAYSITGPQVIFVYVQQYVNLVVFSGQYTISPVVFVQPLAPIVISMYVPAPTVINVNIDIAITISNAPTTLVTTVTPSTTITSTVTSTSTVTTTPIGPTLTAFALSVAADIPIETPYIAAINGEFFIESAPAQEPAFFQFNIPEGTLRVGGDEEVAVQLPGPLRKRDDSGLPLYYGELASGGVDREFSFGFGIFSLNVTGIEFTAFACSTNDETFIVKFFALTSTAPGGCVSIDVILVPTDVVPRSSTSASMSSISATSVPSGASQPAQSTFQPTSEPISVSSASSFESAFESVSESLIETSSSAIDSSSAFEPASIVPTPTGSVVPADTPVKLFVGGPISARKRSANQYLTCDGGFLGTVPTEDQGAQFVFTSPGYLLVGGDAGTPVSFNPDAGNPSSGRALCELPLAVTSVTNPFNLQGGVLFYSNSTTIFPFLQCNENEYFFATSNLGPDCQFVEVNAIPVAPSISASLPITSLLPPVTSSVLDTTSAPASASDLASASASELASASESASELASASESASDLASASESASASEAVSASASESVSAAASESASGTPGV